MQDFCRSDCVKSSKRLEEGNISITESASSKTGLTLRQAALTAGFAYLLMPATLAEFYLYPKVVIPGNIEQTAQNIVAHGQVFAGAILCHLITLMLDVLIAWALYLLLAPVNRSLSLLTAWFRLVYTAIALVAVLNLTTAYRLVNTPVYLPALGSTQLHAQLLLLLNSFRYDWSIGLTIFGIHLALLGYLIFRSGYIPRIIGILLVLDGFYWMITPLLPYFFPNLHPGSLFFITFSELSLPLWLVIRAWKIEDPKARSTALA